MPWIDKHPDRYAPISDGDYVGMQIGEHRHFIQIRSHALIPGTQLIYRGLAIIPAAHAACGHPMPTDWREHNTDFPIAGIVDCERCLEIEARQRTDLDAVERALGL